MTFVVIIYAVLLIVFLVMSALIFRHSIKYGYLSTKFKTIVTIFGLVSLVIILFSIYLVISLFRSPSSTTSPSFRSVTSPTDINF